MRRPLNHELETTCATNPKLKEGKGTENTLEYFQIFLKFQSIGLVFVEIATF